MSEEKCIINLATGHYVNGQERLRKSLATVSFFGRFMGVTSEAAVNAPSHRDNPYAFKIYAFRQVLESGRTQILWLDASVWAITPLDTIFEKMATDGYIMQDAGHWVGRWSNDRCLEYFGITRDEAMKMPMIGNAGFLGLNFNNEVAKEFFSKWEAAMEAGIFKGEWTNDNKTESQDPRCTGHRHDMSCSSIIANQMGLIRQNGQEFLNYGTEPLNDSVCLLAQGM